MTDPDKIIAAVLRYDSTCSCESCRYKLQEARNILDALRKDGWVLMRTEPMKMDSQGRGVGHTGGMIL